MVKTDEATLKHTSIYSEWWVYDAKIKDDVAFVSMKFKAMDQPFLIESIAPLWRFPLIYQ